MLENFKKGGFHLSLVTREVKSSQDSTTEELVGIVTLEDILEEIICAEIVDETDKYVSNRGKISIVLRPLRLNLEIKLLTGRLTCIFSRSYPEYEARQA